MFHDFAAYTSELYWSVMFCQVVFPVLKAGAIFALSQSSGACIQ